MHKERIDEYHLHVWSLSGRTGVSTSPPRTGSWAPTWRPTGGSTPPPPPPTWSSGGSRYPATGHRGCELYHSTTKIIYNNLTLTDIFQRLTLSIMKIMKFRNETQQLTASWTFYILMSWVWSLLCMSVTLDRGLDLKIKYTNEKVFVKIVILMLYIQMLLKAWQIPQSVNLI